MSCCGSKGDHAGYKAGAQAPRGNEPSRYAVFNPEELVAPYRLISRYPVGRGNLYAERVIPT